MCAAARVLIVGVALLATATFGEIRDSHHDWDWYDATGSCYLCHTPHNAITTVPEGPLWNHRITNATFTVYSSSTLDGSPGQPSGISKLCLSCHDGTVAVDSYGGHTGNRFIIPGSLIGTDLTKHHPISMTYDSSLAAADGGLYDPSATSSGLGGTIAQDLLFQGRLECSSCHDVHVSRNTQGCFGCHPGPTGYGDYTETLSLRKDNSGSALCITCHKK